MTILVYGEIVLSRREEGRGWVERTTVEDRVEGDSEEVRQCYQEGLLGVE